MKRRVALIEFSIYDQFPLVSGYLHAYAHADQSVADAFEFAYFTREIERGTYEETLAGIRALRADVLCFSCYVWNMGLVRRLVADLANDPHISTIVMGGHQVSHHIERYVQRTNEKVVIINGQGEIPFRAALQRLADNGDLSGLRGVSFYRDGELWNGGEAEMLKNLDDIPSPFLGGHFDRLMHPITVFETNRGCPYKCTFCTWGGDTLQITKFSIDRLKEELLWIAKKPVFFLFLADANWGILPRDIELSEHIARMKKDHGHPLMVYYAAAKNKPAGSMACIEKFHEGGVITSQALGIQSMNNDTLSLIDRKNIKNSAFLQMFDSLKTRQIDSYCELIWPLPGETLDSLQVGMQNLLELGARTIVMYPAILINNARLTEQRDEHEMQTVVSADWKSELQLVKATKWADREAVDSGLWFYYSQFFLSNCDREKILLRYLSHATGKRYAETLSDFRAYLRANAARSRYADLIGTIFDAESHGALLTIGQLATHLTYEQRLAAQTDVLQFVAQEETAKTVADVRRRTAVSLLWCLSIPKIFEDTREGDRRLLEVCDRVAGSDDRPCSEYIHIEDQGDTTEVRIDDAHETWREAAAWFAGQDVPRHPRLITVHYPQVGLPYNLKDLQRNWVFAHGMIQRLNHITPRFTVDGAIDRDDTARAGAVPVSLAG